jgi:hypothetical protein
VAGRAWLAAVQIFLQIRLIQFQTGRTTIDIQPSARPWLSPKEVTVNSFPKVFPDIIQYLVVEI